MKKFLFASAFLFLTFNSNAQSIDELFAQLNKLVANAKGEKYKGGVFYEAKTVGQQEFSQSSVVCREIDKKKPKTEWVSRYTMMPWAKVRDFYVLNVNDNDKLGQLLIRFNAVVNWEHYTADKNGDADPYAGERIEMYVLEKDGEEVKRLINNIVAFFQKK